MLSFPGPRVLGRFDDTLERHPISLFEEMNAVFFFTTTVFASHSRKKISLIAPASFSLCTSNLPASTYSLADLLGFCFLRGNDGSTLSLWKMNLGSTPGTSYGLHVNTSTFYIRNSNIFILSQSSMLDLIRKYLSVFGNILTLISSSAQPAPCSPQGFCNCYNGASSMISLCLSCSSFQRTAVTRHCQATCWFPLTIATPCSVQNLTFICKMDGMALIA